ncbi:radical SAM protein [Chitinimonas lacunae]|uniref:Radical SAM protein n=1 Tax=Chitinimonas lacunae TaxID=1963018 RepID=A0ABV8MSP7_9NEIS
MHTIPLSALKKPTPPKIRKVQVIFKTVERCNLACTYCYYYFHGDDSANGRPAVVSRELFPAIVDFIATGARDLGLEEMDIIFHGGEPTLQKPRDFAYLCDLIRERIDPVCPVSLGMQTNAVHLSDEWLDCLRRYGVGVGISLDGPAEYHDRFRLDRKGRGSHAQVEANLRRLQAARQQGELPSVGCISVVNSAFSARRIFDYLTDEMGLSALGFLLPDRSWDTPFDNGDSALAYGEFLKELFDAWLLRQDVRVRELNDLLDFLQLRRNEDMPRPPEPDSVRNQILVIQSDGTISVDDSLIPTLEWRHKFPSPHISQTSMRDFFSLPGFAEIAQARHTLPQGCSDCVWKKPCHGGSLENRYSRESGFDNPSVYCDGLKSFYRHVADTLIDNGYPRELMAQKLGVEPARLS